jgi:aromatic-L-amino-acid/L-tryptophan decarboxylase
MDPAALDRMVAVDRADGRLPWVVAAAAGTIDTGAVDPVGAIAEVAERHGIWLHVDAAYGGFFLLTEAGRRLMAGIERADSVVLDPHKTLFVPFGSGMLLVRDGGLLAATHRYEASYLQDARKAQMELSPADLSPELSRPFRALRMWLPLMVHGVAPFRAALEEKHLLARYFHREAARRGFWVGPEPELSVAVYRHVPARLRGDDSPEAAAETDRVNERLVEAIRRDGRVFVSATRLEGRYTLRLAVVVFRTHRATIDRLLAVLDEQVQALGR